VQVSIEKGMIENKNRLKKQKSPSRIKKSKKKFTTSFLFFCMFQDLWNKKKFEKFLVEILQYTKLA
jgi:hypothetical protein